MQVHPLQPPRHQDRRRGTEAAVDRIADQGDHPAHQSVGRIAAIVEAAGRIAAGLGAGRTVPVAPAVGVDRTAVDLVAGRIGLVAVGADRIDLGLDLGEGVRREGERIGSRRGCGVGADLLDRG